MKRILATTALTASLCMPAYAQDATAADPATTPETTAETTAEMQTGGTFIQAADPQDVMASDFIGKRVYAMAKDADFGDEGVADADAGWEDIGEVSDVILARNGEVEGVIVDVGGFLGIGEKPVALTMDSLNLVPDSNSPGQYFVTVTATRDALDQAPAFKYSEHTPPMDQANNGSVATPLEETPGEEVDMAADKKVTDKPMAADPNSEEEMAKMAESGDNAADQAADEVTQKVADADTAKTPADQKAMEGFSRDGYSQVMLTELSSDDLAGLPVYDTNDERVGEISEVLISSDDVVTDAVIDVGGFLGIGEKPVAISFKDISIQKQADGDDLRAYVNTTEEQLKSLPEYDKG